MPLMCPFMMESRSSQTGASSQWQTRESQTGLSVTLMEMCTVVAGMESTYGLLEVYSWVGSLLKVVLPTFALGETGRSLL